VNRNQQKEKTFGLFIKLLYELLLPNLYALLRIQPNSEEFSSLVLNALTELFCGKVPSLGSNHQHLTSTKREQEEEEQKEEEEEGRDNHVFGSTSVANTTTQKQNEQKITPRLFVIDLDIVQLFRAPLEANNDIILSALSLIVSEFVRFISSQSIKGSTERILDLILFLAKYFITFLETINLSRLLSYNLFTHPRSYLLFQLSNDRCEEGTETYLYQVIRCTLKQTKKEIESLIIPVLKFLFFGARILFASTITGLFLFLTLFLIFSLI
jgi:hypothetical protein